MVSGGAPCAMQAVGLRGATASLCCGDSFLAGTSEVRGSHDGAFFVLLQSKSRTSKGLRVATKCTSVLKDVRVASREVRSDVRAQSSVLVDPAGRNSMSAEQKVYDAVAKQAAIVDDRSQRGLLQDDARNLASGTSRELLAEAYARCGEVCAEYAKTFYLGMFAFSLILSPRTNPSSTSHGICTQAYPHFLQRLLNLAMSLMNTGRPWRRVEVEMDTRITLSVHINFRSLPLETGQEYLAFTKIFSYFVLTLLSSAAHCICSMDYIMRPYQLPFL